MTTHVPRRGPGDALEALAARRAGVLSYAIVPPRRSWSRDRVVEEAAAQAERLRELPADVVVVYDVQDESGRTDEPRPFPFEKPVDAVDYAQELLGDVGTPRIIYRCVAQLRPEELVDGLQRIDAADDATVLVGAASSSTDVTMRLDEAHELRRSAKARPLTGGVLIGERDSQEQPEHERVLRKIDAGCSFFVSQAVYAPGPTERVLGGLARACRERDLPVPPVVVTLTPCGSEQTLAFLRWLGVEVPEQLAAELLDAPDTLAASVDACERVFRRLWEHAGELGIPLGCNVESVSLDPDEVAASTELLHRVRAVVAAA